MTTIDYPVMSIAERMAESLLYALRSLQEAEQGVSKLERDAAFALACATQAARMAIEEALGTLQTVIEEEHESAHLDLLAAQELMMDLGSHRGISTVCGRALCKCAEPVVALKPALQSQQYCQQIELPPPPEHCNYCKSLMFATTTPCGEASFECSNRACQWVAMASLYAISGANDQVSVLML